MKPTSQLLEEGAEIIVERGKCEGAMQNETGQVCALGAIFIAKAGSIGAYWADYRSFGRINFMINDASDLVNFNNVGPGPSGGIPTAQETADYMINLAKKYRDRGE